MTRFLRRQSWKGIQHLAQLNTNRAAECFLCVCLCVVKGAAREEWLALHPISSRFVSRCETFRDIWKTKAIVKSNWVSAGVHSILTCSSLSLSPAKGKVCAGINIIHTAHNFCPCCREAAAGVRDAQNYFWGVAARVPHANNLSSRLNKFAPPRSCDAPRKSSSVIRAINQPLIFTLSKMKAMIDVCDFHCIFCAVFTNMNCSFKLGWC